MSDDKFKQSILVIDDHPIVRRGVAGLLAEEPDLCVGGEAQSGKEAIPAILKYKPKMVVLDISFPDCDGIDICRKIRARFSTLPILVMSIHPESLYADRALRAGANGYIMKHEAPDKIVLAIRQILSGNIHVSTNTVRKILGRGSRSTEPRKLAGGVEVLTDRELEVFSLIGQGRATKQIATDLNLGAKTVETHRINIKRKLKIRQLPELVKRAVEWTSANGKTYA